MTKQEFMLHYGHFEFEFDNFDKGIALFSIPSGAWFELNVYGNDCFGYQEKPSDWVDQIDNFGD